MALALRTTLLLFAIPGLALAQPDDAELAARRTRVVTEAAKGPTFRSSGQDYRVVLGVRASETARDAPAGSRPVAAGVAEDDLLEVKGRYAIHLERAGSSSRAGGRPYQRPLRVYGVPVDPEVPWAMAAASSNGLS